MKKVFVILSLLIPFQISAVDHDITKANNQYFDMSVGFWMGLQTHYEVEKAKMILADRLEREVKIYSPA